MAEKLTARTAISDGNVSKDDLIYIVDDVSGTPTSYKATLEQLRAVFPLINGYAGGQTMYGGDSANDDLNFKSTSDATKGSIFLGDSTDGMEWDENAKDFNIYISGQKRISFDGSEFIIESDSVGANGIEIYKYNTNSGSDSARIAFYSSEGTEAAKTASQLDNVLFALNSYGYTGSLFSGFSVLSHLASENWSGSAKGTKLQLRTIKIGQTSPSVGFEIIGAGNIQFNEAYYFPMVDGTSGQVLKTNGGGVLTWSDIGGSDPLTISSGGSSTTLDETGFAHTGSGGATFDATDTGFTWSDGGSNTAGLGSSGMSVSNGTRTTTISDSGFNISRDGGGNVMLDMTYSKFGVGSETDIVFNTGNGTLGTPTAISSGDALSGIVNKGYDGTSYSESASINFSATENFTGSALGTKIDFKTASTGTTTPTTKLSIGDAVTIGAFTLPITDGTASQVLQTDGAGNVTWQTVASSTSYFTETANAIQLDTGATTRDILEVNTGTASTFGGTYTQGNLLIGDSHVFGASSNTIRRSGLGGYLNTVGSGGAYQNSFAWGSSITAEGSNIAVFGASQTVDGDYNFTANSNNTLYGNYNVALGQFVALGTSPANINNSVGIGYDISSYASNQIVIGQGFDTNSSWAAQAGIFFGVGAVTRATSGFFQDPGGASTLPANFVIGGNQACRTDIGAVQSGMGSGMFIMHNYGNTNVTAPSTDIADSIAMYALDVTGGDMGLVVKSESGTKHIFATSVGINTTSPSSNSALDVNGVIKAKTYTVATLPTVVAGGIIYVSDETGGATLAFSDGTNWRRTTDLAIVS